ncbi:MAG TPA: hypothetical protein VJZ04_01215 [Lachnospiraceae bacterium]|nr:hypothetical protein [Lachnospiraceae bacterium]
MKIESKKNLFNSEYVAPIMIGLFFCFLFLYFGIGVYPDTEGYLNRSIGREPLYPTFLWIIRSIAGHNSLVIVCILQNVFAFFVTNNIYQFVQKKFLLNWVFKSAVIACLLLPHIIIPLSAPSRIVLTNSILSEGITLSLYLLFVTCLLKSIFLYHKKIIDKYAAISIIVAFLLSITRSQLMVTILIWGLVFLIKVIIIKRWRKALIVILFLGGVFWLRGITISGYNYMVNDHYVGNTGGNMTILTNVLYSTNVNKPHQIEDQELNGLLQDILETLRFRKLNYEEAPKGFINKVNYQETCHDIIKFEVIDIPIYTFVRQHGYTGSTEVKVQMDQVAGELTKELYQSSIKNWIMVYLQVASGGFIRTVAFLNPIFNWYTLLIYLSAIILMSVLFMKKNGSKITHSIKNESNHQVSSGAIMMLLVLTMICANVLATSIMIMCLSRYMIYNMSLFYIAYLVMIWEIVQILRRDTKKIDGTA